MKLALAIDSLDPGQGRLGEMVRRMARAQTLHPDQETRVIEGPGFSLACTTAGEKATRCPALRESPGGNILAFAGYPVHLHEDTRNLLDKICLEGSPAALAKLPELDGPHALVLWDRERSRLVISSDHGGMQPFYFGDQDGTRLFASEMRALAEAGASPPAPDAEGWAAFIGLGHMALDLTMLAGARAFPPASLLEINTASGEEQWRETWSWPSADPTPREPDTGHLVDLLRREIQACQDTYHPGGVHLLSGGWDSRLLLAVRSLVATDLRTVAVRYRFDPRHEADSDLAGACAKAVGARHREVVPRSGFYRGEQFQRFLTLTEVATPALDLLVPTVMSAIRPSMAAVWEGIAIGAAHYGNPPGMRSVGDFLAQELAAEDSKAWLAADALFRADFAAELRDGIASLQRRVEAAYGDSPEELLRFRVGSRSRFRTAKVPFAVYQHEVATFCPALSRAYWTATRSMPATAASKKPVAGLILQRHFPALARIPVLSGGEFWPEAPPPPSRGMARRLARKAAATLLSWSGRDGWHKERVIESALREVNLDDPLVNADLVRRLRDDPRRAGDGSGQMRRLLFYWHHWSRAMGRPSPAP